MGRARVILEFDLTEREIDNALSGLARLGSVSGLHPQLNWQSEGVSATDQEEGQPTSERHTGYLDQAVHAKMPLILPRSWLTLHNTRKRSGLAWLGLAWFVFRYMPRYPPGQSHIQE